MAEVRYRVSDAKVAWRVVDEEAVLLHADTSGYFGLNKTGTALWGVLAEHAMTQGELAGWARLHLQDTPAALASDIAEFIHDLEKLDLLEPFEDGQLAAGGRSGPAEGEAATEATAYERPAVVQFGELEKLILSGE